MAIAAWGATHWEAFLGAAGIIGGLFFSGLGYWTDARARRAQTVVEITKLHRELWMEFIDREELASLFDQTRNMTARPLTPNESRFANMLFLHIRATFYAERARIYVRPEHLREDIQEIFSHPAPLAAWKDMRHLHDRDFIAFIEGFLPEPLS